jgi:hypothetical protein
MNLARLLQPAMVVIEDVDPSRATAPTSTPEVAAQQAAQ